MRSVVVLPEPDGPSIEKNSPSRDRRGRSRRPRRRRRTASRRPRAARPATAPAAAPGVVAGAGAPCSCAWSSTWACGSPAAGPSCGSAVLEPAGCVVTRGCVSSSSRTRGSGVGAPAFPVPSAARSGAHARWRRAAVSSDLRPAVSGAVSRIMTRCTPRSAIAAVAGVLAVAVCRPATRARRPATPPITPGTSGAPREVNVVTRDYAFVPSIVDLAPGETVLLHVINGGLEQHEAIFGPLDDQLAWEAAEEAVIGAPPGPTPYVAPPPGFEGVRVVVGSGQRVDVTWTVPADAAPRPTAGSSAATSPATGRRAWSCRCAWSGPTGTRWARRRRSRRSVPRAADGARRLDRAASTAGGRSRRRRPCCKVPRERRSVVRSCLARAVARGPRPRTFGRAFGS